MYDPQIGRFHTIDPMAVFTPGISPYAYAHDNPVLYRDEYGLGIFSWLTDLIHNVIDAVAQAFGFHPMGQWGVNHRFENRRGPNHHPHLAHQSPGSPRITYKESPIILESDDTEVADVDLDAKPINVKPNNPSYKGIPIADDKDNKPFTFSADIPFDYKSNYYDIAAADKTLSDLVKSLQDYSQLEVMVCGNVWGGANDKMSDPSSINGVSSTAGGLARARANAIKDYLIGKGISGNRIKAWIGNIYTDKKRGQSTSFELRKQ